MPKRLYQDIREMFEKASESLRTKRCRRETEESDNYRVIYNIDVDDMEEEIEDFDYSESYCSPFPFWNLPLVPAPCNNMCTII